MPFDRQPTIDDTLLKLRPLKIDDYDELFAVASDPLIWEQHPKNDRYKRSVFHEFFRGAMDSGGALVIMDPETGMIIGSSRYFGYDKSQSEVEIGWTFLARSYWGGKYNQELKRLMLAHAFQFVDQVVFLVGEENLRSRRAMEKIGGVLAGSRHNATGEESLVYEIKRLGWINESKGAE